MLLFLVLNFIPYISTLVNEGLTLGKNNNKKLNKQFIIKYTYN